MLPYRIIAGTWASAAAPRTPIPPAKHSFANDFLQVGRFIANGGRTRAASPARLVTAVT